MILNHLSEQIRSKKSYLCVGLDTDLTRIPEFLRSNPNAIVDFNKKIIDATKDVCVAYKINTAFYEALGARGWDAMEETVDYIPQEHFKIADAKRADIGNTSTYYAKAFFERLKFDAITVAPYMGEDSIRPFLEYPDKCTIVLGLTSNPGAADFELKKILIEHDYLEEGVHIHRNRSVYLYEYVLEKISKWGGPDKLMFVVGATQASEFKNIRKLVPEHFLLVPGVGVQGGSLNEVSQNAMNSKVGILVNVSRAIIYASEDESFATEARAIAEQYVKEMGEYL